MLDFQRKKDINLTGNISQTDNSYINQEHSKNVYDYILKHDSQINEMK